MAKITLSDIADIRHPSAATNINANNALIETALENTLSRDGTTPNTMSSDLDMNSNDLLNVGLLDASDVTVDGNPVEGILTQAIEASNDATDSATAAAASASSAAASANSSASSATASAASAAQSEGAIVGAVRYNTDQTLTRLQKIQARDNINLESYINALDYCVADGVTDDYAGIISAKDAAIAQDKSLYFPEGTYAFSNTLEFASIGLAIVAGGPNVVLKHTGSGYAVSFSGPSVDSGASYNQVFGGPNRFNIQGNTNTTVLLYTNLVHRSKFFVELRDGEIGWQNGIPADSDSGTVLNTYDIVCSANNGFFVKTPYHGAIMYGLYAAECRLLVEGCGGSFNYGCHLNSGFNNNFYGTSEGCLTGGFYIGPSAVRNCFIGFDCEVNGSGYDWLVEGGGNTFITCSGAITNSGQYVSGSRNTFINCYMEGLTVDATSSNTKFDRCDLSVLTGSGSGFVNNSTTTKIDSCIGVSDSPKNSVPFGGSSAGSSIAAGETKYVVNSLSSTESNVYIPVGISGTFKNLRILSDGSPGVGQTYTATVRKTLADTSLTCAIPAGTNVAMDSTNTVHFDMGDRLAIKVVSSASAATTPLSWSLEFVPD